MWNDKYRIKNCQSRKKVMILFSGVPDRLRTEAPLVIVNLEIFSLNLINVHGAVYYAVQNGSNYQVCR